MEGELNNELVNNQCLINGPYHLSRTESKVAPTGSSTSKNNLEDIHDAVSNKVLTDGSFESLYVVIKNGNIKIHEKDDFLNSGQGFAPTDQVYYLHARSESNVPIQCGVRMGKRCLIFQVSIMR